MDKLLSSSFFLEVLSYSFTASSICNKNSFEKISAKWLQASALTLVYVGCVHQIYFVPSFRICCTAWMKFGVWINLQVKTWPYLVIRFYAKRVEFFMPFLLDVFIFNFLVYNDFLFSPRCTSFSFVTVMFFISLEKMEYLLWLCYKHFCYSTR